MHGMKIKVKTHAEFLVENLAKSKGFGREKKSGEEIILKMFLATLILGKKGVYNWL
jgi:hypothetical protein